jgi:hypothetical protein
MGMKDGNEPRDADATMKPQQQQGEEFGSVKGPQVTDRNIKRRSNTARGSEPETRATSGRRG